MSKDAAGKNKFKRLDMSKSATRDKVSHAVTIDELDHIFDTDGFFAQKWRAQMHNKIKEYINQEYYLKNYTKEGQIFVALYLRNIYNLDTFETKN